MPSILKYFLRIVFLKLYISQFYILRQFDF